MAEDGYADVILWIVQVFEHLLPRVDIAHSGGSADMETLATAFVVTVDNCSIFLYQESVFGYAPLHKLAVVIGEPHLWYPIHTDWMGPHLGIASCY